MSSGLRRIHTAAGIRIRMITRPPEQHPHVTPADGGQEDRGHQGDGGLGEALTQVRDGHGAAALLHEPAGDGDIDHEVAHQGVADGNRPHPYQREFPEGAGVSQQEEARDGDDRTDDHEPAGAVTVQQGADPRRHAGVAHQFQCAHERESTA